MLVLRLEKLLRVLYSSLLAAQTQSLLRTAWLVCLSLVLSRHSTCERGGRLYTLLRESVSNRHKILHNNSWQFNDFNHGILLQTVHLSKRLLKHCQVFRVWQICSVFRSVYFPAVPAAATSSGQCSLDGEKIVKISPDWGSELRAISR